MVAKSLWVVKIFLGGTSLWLLIVLVVLYLNVIIPKWAKFENWMNVKTYWTVSTISWYMWYNILITISNTISFTFPPNIPHTLSLWSLLPHFKSMRCHILLDLVRVASYSRQLSAFFSDFPLTDQPHHWRPMANMISVCQWCARPNKVGYMKLVELPVIYNEDSLMCNVICSRINMFKV